METPDLKRILMVEDDLDIQTVARFALEAVGGFAVQVCGDGKNAIAQSRAFAPDLILLDVMMPDMDGPSVLKALRANSQMAGTPVIFMTAKVQPQEIAQYKELGALDVIACSTHPVFSGDAVAVWVRLPTVHAVPDLLRCIGYSIKDDELIARTLMRRE